MTNQQGAPEALRLAAEVLDWMPTSDTQRALWDRHQKALVVVKAALVEAQQPAPSAAADPQLLKFYGVTTDAELIAAQARHIERLQAKLPQNQSFAPQRVREG